MKLSHGILTVLGVVLSTVLFFGALHIGVLYYYDHVTVPEIMSIGTSPTVVKDIRDVLDKEPIQEQLLTEEQKPTYNDLKSVTVVIQGTELEWNDENQELNERGWMGTGVIIADTKDAMYILTNKHVAPKQQQGIYISVENVGPDDLVTAEVIANSEEDDLSLIKINTKLYQKNAIYGFAKSLSVGDKLYMVGHHLGRRFIYGEGIFAGYDEDVGVAQVPTLFGDSGSGLFNQNKEMVGIIFAGSIFPTGPFSYGFDVAHGIFVTIDNVKVFLRGLLNINVD